MTIIVNGREKTWPKPKISFAQVAMLAYPKWRAKDGSMPSMTFFKANQEKHEGIFNPGTSVKISDGTRFNCHFTSNA